MSNREPVRLSVIIPTFNRVGRLRACLEALSRQTVSVSAFEVIAVVDGSIDGTLEMLTNLKTPYTLRVIRQDNQGQCVALNAGVAAAAGMFCLFLDDDIIAVPELVAEHLQAQMRSKGVVGIGQIRLALPPDADWYARCFARGWRAQYEQLNRGERLPSWMDCYGGNMSVPRTAYLAVKGNAIDLSRNYDIDLAYRLEQHGLSFIYIPGAVGFQDERKSCRELSADSEMAGAASVELCRRHPAILPQLFGSFGAGGWRKRLLRRALLALHVPPRLLEWIGRPLADTGTAHRWFGIIQNYCYWRGARRAVPDWAGWNRLTRKPDVL